MASFDSLPYIDADITEAERNRANALVSRELSLDRPKSDHPSLLPAYQPRKSLLVQSQIDRLISGETKENGIDLTRYEASDEVAPTSDSDSLRQALRTVHTNSTYLEGRQTNISLLEDYGKNAWLIGNAQLENLHTQLESELASLKRRAEDVNRSRKSLQEDSRGELLALEDTWKQAIGRIIETQIATNKLKQGIVEARNSNP